MTYFHLMEMQYNTMEINGNTMEMYALLEFF